MTDITAMIGRLTDAGCDPVVAAQVVADAYVAGLNSAAFRGIPVDTVADKRRAYDRERKRKQRENPDVSTGHSTGIHRTPPESAESVSIRDNITTIFPLEVEAPQKPVHRTRGCRLPDDWKPSPQDLVIAHQLLGEEGTREEIERFRDHWKQQAGAKGVKLDWNAAWRNWVRRAAEYRGARNGRANQNRTNPVAGRATAREAEFVATMGNTAMRWLKDRGAGGQPGQVSPRSDSAGQPDADTDPAFADLAARCGIG